MKRFFSVLIICLCLTLSSFAFVACDKDKDDEKQVPVYQGMVVSSMVQPVTTFSFGFNGGHDNDDHNYNDRYHDGRDHYDDKNHHGDTEDRNEHIDQDKPFEDSVPDIEDVADSLIVVGGGESLYYASANESVYITIKLSNPDSFEIMSFTLNGKKYSSYMFEDGSDMENLILKVDVGTAVGIHDYTIDAIKYVDGTQIKDVIMDGDKTVKIGVGSAGSTYATVSSTEIGLNSIDLTVNLTDVYGLISSSNGTAKIFLYNETGIIEQKSLNIGTNNISFEGLQPNTLYQYAIIASYDDLTGTGKVVHTLYKQAFNTHSIVLFDSEVTVSQESVSYSYVWDNEMQNKTIVSQELYLDGEKVKDINVGETEIDGLYCNRNYTLVTTYKNLNNQNETILLYFTTFAKQTPTIRIVSIDSGIDLHTGFKFNITTIDPDNVGSLSKLELLHGTDAPIELDLTDRRVDGLLSNNEYIIRATYTYDLGDGLGNKTLVKECAVKTMANRTPILEIYKINDSLSHSSVSLNIITNDYDDVGSLKLELLHGEDEPIILKSSNVTGLLSNTDYTIRATLTYNLNEGTESVTLVEELSFKTLAKQAPTMFLQIDENSITQTSAEFDVQITDTDNTGSLKLELLRGANVPIEISSESRNLSNLYTNSDYTIKATYTYDLNDGTGNKTIIQELSFKTLAKKIPTMFLKIYEDSITQTSVEFGYDIDDEENLIITPYLYLKIKEGSKVNNPDSYSQEFALAGLKERKLTGLLSGVSYTLEISYGYNLNDGISYHWDKNVVHFTTLEKATPTMQITQKVDSLTQTGIEFDINISDVDSVGSLTKLELLYGEDDPVELDLASRSVNGLLSNNDYIVKATYTYDLNDGTGSKTIVKELEFKTIAKETPTVTICDVSSTQNSISFDYSVVDNDSICELSYIEIWKGEELVKKNDVDNKNFSDLDGNTKYQIRVYYSYNLNNGLESVSTYAEYDYYTLAEEVSVTDITVLNQTNPKVGEEVHVRVSFDNPSNVVLNSIFINGQEISVVGGDVTSSAIIKFIPETDGGDYEVKINKITYNREDVILTQNITSEYTDSVLVLGDIFVKKVYNDHEDGIFTGDNIFYVELDNPTGYDISSIKGKINDSYSDSKTLTILSISEDKQVLTIKDNSLKYGFNNIIIDAITYGIEGGEFTSKTFEQIETKLFKIKSNEIREISTAEELASMEDYYIYSLTADIDMKNIEWMPKDFVGVFYGNNKKIKNLTIVYEDASILSISKFGIFGLLTGFCADLNIENVYMSLKNSKGFYFGALAGTISGKVTNVKTSGNIFVENGENSFSNFFIGGLCGSGYAIIENCSTSVSIDYKNNGSIDAGSALGGFVGYVSSESIINNSYATGNVVFTENTDTTHDFKVGGFIGDGRDLAITNCYATGNVIGGYSGTGGFIGDASSSTITNCYATGDVIGTDYYVGGFIGDGRDLTITNCYATGDVTGGYSRTGGFIGEGFYLTITNCYAMGEVTGENSVGGFIGYGYSSTITNCYATGDVIGIDYSYVGGFIGNGYYLTLSNCYATGNVTGGYSDTGGFIGYGDDSTITNCYATGDVAGEKYVGGFIGVDDGLTISNCYAIGDVIGTDYYVGGFIGEVSSSTITNCYATGDVTGINCVGGFIGLGSSTITNCYRYEGQIIDGYGTNSNEIVASMEEIWVFVKENWDNDVWNLYDDKNPTLKEVSNS